MKFGNRFVEIEIEDGLKSVCTDCELKYYQYPLNTKNSHFAHVFICQLKDKQLKQKWELIQNNIATSVQGKVESLLERSNFYICFFVDGSENKKLQSEIEEDRYSAKKFVVFSDGVIALEEKLEWVEHRIFDFQTEIQNCGTDMLKSLKVKHFRSYLGEHNFDFASGDKVAKLVVLYAPNGYGKTSFFDAVEWGLTNKIDRFDEVKYCNYDGKSIVKNINAPEDETGFVELGIENEKTIIREISELDSRSSQDVERKTKVNYVPSSIEKDYMDVLVWKNVILPHHKIDGFITAADPNKIYKEWGGIWDPEKTIRSEFELKYNEKRECEKELVKLSKECIKSEKEYEEINQTRPFLAKLQEDVKQYNKLDAEQPYESIDFMNMTSTEYMKWSDDVNIRYDSWTKKRDEIEKKIKYISESIDNDIKIAKEFLVQIEDLEQNQKRQKTRLDKVKKKKEIVNAINALQKSLVECNEQMKVKSIVCDHDIFWYDEMKHYYQQADKYPLLQKNQRDIQESRKAFEEEKSKKQLILQKYKSDLKEERQYLELKQHMECVSGYQISAEKAKKEIEKAEECLYKEEQSKEKVMEELEKVTKSRLDNFIVGYERYKNHELEMEEIDAELLNKLDKIKAAYANYNKLDENLKEINMSILEQEKLSKEWKNVVDNGRKIIEKEKRKVCPLCKKEWGSYEELLQHTYDKVQIINQDTMTKQSDIRRRKDDYEKQITKEIAEFENVRKLVLEKINNQVKKIQKSINDLFKKKKECESKEKEYQGLIDALFEKDNKFIAEYSQEQLGAWYISWKKTLNQQIEHLETEIEQQNRQIEMLDNTYKFQAESMEQYEKNMEQIEKREDIEIREKAKEIITQSEYNIIKDEQKELEIRIKQLESEREQKEVEKKQYDDIDEEQEKIYQKNVDDILTNLMKMKEENNKILLRIGELSGVKKLDKEHVEHEKTQSLIESQRVNRILEALKCLKYNKNIEQYFENWKDKNEKYKEFEEKVKASQEILLDKEQKFQDAKSVIEETMQNFLQNVQINEVYRKIDPHQDMKQLKPEFKFNDKDQAELHFKVQGEKDDRDFYPEWYFSTAQLNAVAFSIFLGKALHTEKVPLKTIFIDDPVGHFDDMNIVGFADLVRNIIDNTNRQLIISTHEEKVFSLLKRKLPDTEYDAKYISLKA